jgi:hypothetical protein
LAREEYNISDEEFNNILFNAIYNVAEVDFD